jgi:hypothetical protein
MRDRVLHLLRNVILVCAFGVASCLVLARPTGALQVVLGPPVAVDKSTGTGRYTLSGTVVDAVTGAPIHRALVEVMGTQSQAVLTDEGGKFRFENLAQGQVVVNAHKPGYSDPRAISSSIFAMDTPIMIGRDAAPLVLKLNPDSAIVVKVTSEDGEGVESLPVSLLASQVQQGRRYWGTSGEGQTNEQGEYRSTNLVPGKYYVSVGPSSRPIGLVGSGAQASDAGYPRVFYPNATELEGAAVVEVSPGKRARLELVVSTVPLYRISGAVEGGTPGQGCNLQFLDISFQEIAVGVRMNAATGVFRSDDIPAGFYTLVANCTVDGEMSLAGRMPVRVGSNISNVSLSVSPMASIPVEFRTSDTRADASEDIPLGRIFLRGKERSGRRGPAWSEQESDTNERKIVVKRVEPGSYAVDVHPNFGYYVESARYGSIDLLTDDLTVPEGGSTETIVVVLRNDGATLNGNVRGAGGAPAVGMVLLVPSRAPRLAQVARVANGAFKIRNLAPGSYRAVAIEQADDLEYTNPEVVKDYLTKGQDIRLSSKQESRVDLELVQKER